MRRIALSIVVVGALGLAACGGDDSSEATDTTSADGGSGNDCAKGKTLTEGTLTIATGNPAFEPWVLNDSPESGEGFEAAVAYAVAEQLGFSYDTVSWVRTGFDEAIQAGAKNFDFNLQQYTITNDRKEKVGFSEPYYRTNQAVVVITGSPAENATSASEFKELKIGVQANTTSLDFVNDVIAPTQEPYIYNDNADVKAAFEANQIDALVADVPTAFYMAAAELENAKIVGQFPREEGDATDSFGLLTEKDSPLLECLDAAITLLTDDGTLESIADRWLSESTNVPIIER